MMHRGVMIHSIYKEKSMVRVWTLGYGRLAGTDPLV